MKRSRYLLRHAAGCYWLLDVEQDGRTFCQPLPLNKTGAALWKSIESGKNREECAEQLAECYGISKEQALMDVQLFLEELKRHDVMIPDINSLQESVDGV